MEVITSHINLDFDGFASMLAASKLYPNAKIVLPNVISKEVRDFLTLYRTFLDLKEFREINLSNVSKLIIVDTSSKNRVADFTKLIEQGNIPIEIFDHHTEEENQITAEYVENKKLGACTSILVNKIAEKGIKIRPLESTILALGIYSDTNCLTFSSTTVEDAKAVTHLLECGAYLDVISNFVGQPLSIKQQEAFDLMSKEIKNYAIKGLDIGITAVYFGEYIDEIAYLTHKILSLKDYDAVFSIVCIKNRIYLVGRSTVQEINIGQIMRQFNGSGHPKAGSTIIKGENLYDIKDKLIKILHKVITPSISAKDIMNYPVKTVTEEISLKDVDRIMLRYGHSGIPVLKNEKIIGIITRRDVEKAVHHGYGHSPVKAYMSRNVICVEPDTPIKELQHIMIEHNVGRLPVVENDRVIGIVTRTDILKQIFGKDSPVKYKKIYIESNTKKFKRNYTNEILKLPVDVQEILREIGLIGDLHNSGVYVVGGFVRDLLLGHNNLDIDIVVDGDGIEIAKEVSKKYNGNIVIHKNFQTSVVEIGEYKLDIVTARREFYEYPAALPTVERGSIDSDLYRRDFTVNSMAISLNSKTFGNIIDNFGGQRDLQHGFVRILYNLSFVEDPTRIFRAVRFEQRYRFKIEQQTYGFMLEAISSGVLKNVSNERLSAEIMLILNEKNSAMALIRMIEIGLLEALYPQIAIDDDIVNKLKEVKNYNLKKGIDIPLLYLLTLFHKTDNLSMHTILENLKLKKMYRNSILTFTKLMDEITEKLKNINICNYEIYKCLNELNVEMLTALDIITDNSLIKERIQLYLCNLREVKLFINGKVLKELGLKSGPMFNNILQKIFTEKLNGNLETAQNELEYAKKLLNKEV